jgi:hypothetical protein
MLHPEEDQVRKKISLALILILMLTSLSIAATDEKPLRFDTWYEFRGFPTRPDGRTLAWEGYVYVDDVQAGTIQWWMFLGPGLPVPPDVTPFEDAEWIITLSDGTITGEEWGSTTWLPGFERANWRANGRVTDATGGYTYLIGRPMHDGGKVVLSVFPFYGTGKLHINK